MSGSTYNGASKDTSSSVSSDAVFSTGGRISTLRGDSEIRSAFSSGAISAGWEFLVKEGLSIWNVSADEGVEVSSLGTDSSSSNEKSNS